MPAILPSPAGPDDGRTETLATRLESARRTHAYAVAADFGTASTGELLYILVSLRDELGALLDAVEVDLDHQAPAAVVDVDLDPDQPLYVVDPLPARFRPDAFPAAVVVARRVLDEAAAVDVVTATRMDMVRAQARLSGVLQALVAYSGGSGVPPRIVEWARQTAAEVNATNVGEMSLDGLAYQFGLLRGTVRAFVDAAVRGAL
ncbi:hypothetical protein [Yinghuangia sp. YIM S10712]|uniref:hypothetical protein n=1 Tax=Yinghuangia sp. YIM S10712 TaxID=3436930 RepID=UPI003F5317CA